MNTPGLLKCAGAVVALVTVSACASGSTVAPSAATLNATYVGRTLFVNGSPVTAERLNPLPRYAELVLRMPQIRSEELRVRQQLLRLVRQHFRLSKKRRDDWRTQWPRRPRVHHRFIRLWQEDFSGIPGAPEHPALEFRNTRFQSWLRTLPLPYTVTSSCAMEYERRSCSPASYWAIRTVPAVRS